MGASNIFFEKINGEFENILRLKAPFGGLGVKVKRF
jgi:hypothetical protein